MPYTQLTPYQIKMDSTIFSLSSLPVRAFQEIKMFDSIFTFYPKASVSVNDSAGILIDNVYFVEGLEFDLSIGNDDEGWIDNKYVWVRMDLTNATMGDYVSGYITFSLSHHALIGDLPKPRAFNGTVKDAVAEMVADDFGIEDTTNISSTTGSRTYYQMNRHTSEFIKTLAMEAFDQSYDNSPFFTFFNNKNEFYFMSIGQMFDQPSVVTLEAKDSVEEENLIKGLSISAMGLPFSKGVYNQKFYTIDLSGEISSENLEMKNYYYKDGIKTKLMVRKDDISSEPSKIIQFGVIDKSKESDFIKGIKNNLYNNFNTLYRMVIVCEYSEAISGVCAGKIVTLDIGSSNPKKAKGSEHSGNWLVLESIVSMDYDGSPFLQLTIGRPAIPVDTQHPLYDDFLS